jgi:Flp pilus assembly protein TadG
MIRRRQLKSRTSCVSAKRGVAVVELAVCLPILVVILMATIETCAMLQLQQNLTVTAFEGARVGIIPGVEASTVQSQCQLLLDDRNISSYTITLDPSDPTIMGPGDEFTVTVAADCAANSIIGSVFYDGKIMTESVVMLAD